MALDALAVIRQSCHMCLGSAHPRKRGGNRAWNDAKDDANNNERR